MEHRRLDEDEFLCADIQAVAAFDNFEIPILLIVPFQGLDGIGGAVDRGIGYQAHELRQSASVVAFSMSGNNVVDILEIDFLL